MQGAFVRASLLALAASVGVNGALASKVALAREDNAFQHRRFLRAGPHRQQLSTIQVQERKVEDLEAAERDVLKAQQVALEALTAQQGALAAQQQVLQAEQKQLADHLATMHNQQAPSAASALGKDAMVEKVVGAGAYMVFVCIVAWIYHVMHVSDFASPKRMPPENRRDFQFGLFDGLQCDPDMRICFFSCCCSPIRWADTVSDFKVGFLDFWPALLLFSLLQVAGSFTFGLSGLLLLLLVVQTRQRMRQSFDLPFGTCETTCTDCCAWAFCAPCAVMQEALQVEFVEPPLPQTMHGPRGPHQSYK